LADNSGQVIYFADVPYLQDGYWGLNISGGNLSKLGEYNYGIKCGENSFGGTSIGAFNVTPSGQGGTENTIFFIFIILLLYGITFIGFFGKNIPMTIYLVSQGIIIYRDNITLYIAYLTIAIGGITTFWAILEQLDVI